MIYKFDILISFNRIIYFKKNVRFINKIFNIACKMKAYHIKYNYSIIEQRMENYEFKPVF